MLRPSWQPLVVQVEDERLTTTFRGGLLFPLMLLISILLGLIPLGGIAWIVVSGTLTTVDGLFESIIMLSISGVFFLNVFWELRDKGLFGKSETAPSKQPPPSEES
jgi:hypothetical protein